VQFIEETAIATPPTVEAGPSSPDEAAQPPLYMGEPAVY
jgi:hypothetical protein